jgi:hypothetical protein
MKRCRYDSSKRCFHWCCGIFNRVSGNVSVCPLFRGGEMFAPRKVAPSVVSVFSKHGRVDRRGGGGC